MPLKRGPLSSQNGSSSHQQNLSPFLANNSHYLPFATLKMSQNTRTQNSDQEGDPRRNNPPQYNLRPFLPQVGEQEGDEPPLMASRRPARHQPRCETKMECLEQRIDTLTELVNTLVTALGENATSVTPAIPKRIPFVNANGEEAPPLEEG